MKRLAVIMAGGSGERFWPASTKDRPKQLLALGGDDRSLLNHAWDRCEASADEVYLATLPHLAQASQADAPRISEEQVLCEPEKRNTLGAILWAAASLQARHGEASMGFFPADQLIEPQEEFAKTCQAAMALAESHEGIVTIGIPPTRAETGFGYIELGTAPHEVLAFREKPDEQTAEQYLASGRHLWNAGIFFFTTSGLLNALKEISAELASTYAEITQCLIAEEEQAAKAAFSRLPSESFDYAVMEKAPKVQTIPATFTWDDVGAWDALERTRETDGNGNVRIGKTRAIDAEGCILASHTDQEIAIIGADDLIVVSTDDAILIAPKNRAQEVRRLAKGEGA